MKLFVTKGYEKTSLQDIIDQLGGLTKGAIYHHFKSKEDILIAVVNYICKDNAATMAEIRDDKKLNGKQKLEKMFDVSLQNPKQDTLFSVTPNLLDNPTFLTYYLKGLIQGTIPYFVTPVLQEGVKDGSIHTEYPEELASVIMFLSDVWLNPLIINCSVEELIRKGHFLNQLMAPYGFHLISDLMLDRLTVYHKLANRNNEEDLKDTNN